MSPFCLEGSQLSERKSILKKKEEKKEGLAGLLKNVFTKKKKLKKKVSFGKIERVGSGWRAKGLVEGYLGNDLQDFPDGDDIRENLSRVEGFFDSILVSCDGTFNSSIFNSYPEETEEAVGILIRRIVKIVEEKVRKKDGALSKKIESEKIDKLTTNIALQAQEILDMSWCDKSRPWLANSVAQIIENRKFERRQRKINRIARKEEILKRKRFLEQVALVNSSQNLQLQEHEDSSRDLDAGGANSLRSDDPSFHDDGSSSLKGQSWLIRRSEGPSSSVENLDLNQERASLVPERNTKKNPKFVNFLQKIFTCDCTKSGVDVVEE